MLLTQCPIDKVNRFLHMVWIASGRRQILLAGLLCSLVGGLHAEPGVLVDVSDKQAKSVTQIVLGILSYARWPVESEQLRLCLIGPTQYADDLIRGDFQSTGRRLIVSRLLADNSSIIQECDVAYVGKLSFDERIKLFNSLLEHPILSISEGGDQCTVGSLFCLRLTNEQSSFEVNLDSVARSGLRIHPSVLQLSGRKQAAQ